MDVGDNQFLKLNDPLLNATAATVCVWAKKRAYKQYQGLIADYDSGGNRVFILGYETPENSLRFYAANNTYGPPASQGGFTQGKWHHVCGVFDGDKGKVYLYVDGDGNSVSTDLERLGDKQSTVSFIGAYHTSYPFQGTIDEVMIFKRALSKEEIRALYDARKYQYYTTISGLDETKYNYTAYVRDLAGKFNLTETRFITVNRTPASIDFLTPPTPKDLSQINITNVTVNLTTDRAFNYSTFVDWNRSLYAWVSFDAYNETGVYDNSSYKRFLGYYGGISSADIVPGPRGDGLSLEKAADYVYTALPSIEVTAQSMEVWIKVAEKTGSWADILNIRSDDYNRIHLESGDNSIVWYIPLCNTTPGITFDSNVIPEIGKWYHIVTTSNGTNAKIYVNGVLKNSADRKGKCDVEGLYVGSGGGEAFNGSVDEVKIWLRELSADEVNASYNSNLQKYQRNFTDVPEDIYTFRGYAIDEGGNVNTTEQRSIFIDKKYPGIEFSNPTPANNIQTPRDNVRINVSVEDTAAYSTWIDWNRSLAGYWSFDVVQANGTINDSSTYSNAGLMQNYEINRTYAGKRGKALYLDGEDDYVRFWDYESISFDYSSFSIEGWIRANDTNCSGSYCGWVLDTKQAGSSHSAVSYTHLRAHET